jgi:hypothetical protein
MNRSRIAQGRFLLAGVVLVAMIASAANAATVTWLFQGNAYSGAIIGDLSGEVTVTLDDEGTPGSVNMRVDATDLSDTGQDAITTIFLNTAFDSDAGFVQVAPTIGGNTFVSRANNEDGFSAGNTSPGFQDGPLFDLRLSFNTPTGGGDLLGVDNPIFEATLTLTGGDLTVSDFFPQESTVNPSGMGDQGPFQVSLRAVQLPGGGDGYLAGVVPGLQIDDFNGGDDVVTFSAPGPSNTEYSNAAGGFRQLEFLDGTTGDSLAVGGGTLTHEDTPTGLGSSSKTSWGLSGGMGTGGGVADFTDGGTADRIRFDGLSIGPNDTLSLGVLDQDNNEAEVLVDNATSGSFDVLFSDFGPVPGVGFPVDFSSIFLMDLEIDTANGSSVVIDSIFTVPEPTARILSAAALTTLACLRMLGRRRRH